MCNQFIKTFEYCRLRIVHFISPCYYTIRIHRNFKFIDCGSVAHQCPVLYAGADPGVEIRGAYGKRGARAYNGFWGLCPQRGLGAEPLVGGSGGEAPLQL